VVLGVALALVFGIAQLLGAGGGPGSERVRSVAGDPIARSSMSEPVSTADARPTSDHGPAERRKKRTPKPLAEPSGACERSDIVASPEVVGTAYAGSLVRFRVRLTTEEMPACTWTVSSTSLVVKLISGTDRIWSSQDCPSAVPTRQVVVRKKLAAKVHVTWRGQRSDAECSRAPEWAQPGWYHVAAAAFGAEPTDEQFQLVPPVAETITAKPKPQREQQKSENAHRD